VLDGNPPVHQPMRQEMVRDLELLVLSFFCDSATQKRD